MKRLPPWAPYAIPFLLFLALTSLEPLFRAYYPQVYFTKVLLVTLCALCLRPGDLSQGAVSGRSVGTAVAFGVALTALWFAVDAVTPVWLSLGKRPAYDPFREIASPLERDIFLAVRFFGLVVLVPWIEEVFYRGFLLRFVTDMDRWKTLAVDKFSKAAIGVNIALFASSHPEWLAAAVFAVGMIGCLKVTGDVRACILAHAVTNLLLGIYVIHFGAWKYW